MQEFGPYKQQERIRTFQQKLIFQDSPYYAVFTPATFFNIIFFLFKLYDWTQDNRTPRKINFSREFGWNFIYVAAGIKCIKF